MSTMEITLLIAGVIIFVLSFLIPDRKSDKEESNVDPAEIRHLMENELNGMKLKVNEATNETVEYAMEKAERQLERVSNEKIMALSEYSDTIMEGIDKSHQEVLFMYDMLSDKQTDLKNTVRKAEATAREVGASGQSATKAEAEVNVSLNSEPEAKWSEPVFPQAGNIISESDNKESDFSEGISATTLDTNAVDDTNEVADNGDTSKEGNSNRQILMLSELGYGTVEIAKTLGLGVGEVKLVLDLFKE